MAAWVEDVLGAGYEQRTLDLGSDPDGEGEVVATLVRATPPKNAKRAFLWVHGFSDYFFQTALADFFTERGYAFYALDLRKCGRSRRPGQTPHYVSDLGLYDAELDQSLAIIREETGGLDVMLGAHSTGGLILPLWLSRLNKAPGGTREAGITGLVLDGPWFDLQGAAWMRSIGTQVIRAAARVRPFEALRLPPGNAYGSSLHVSSGGEWDYDLEWKPLTGYPVTYGWLNAVRRGHAVLHRGLDIGVPSLVLRSDASHFARKHGPRTDVSDAVLDVKQIARWAGCLGDAVTSIPVPGARHDVFLSQKEAREAAYAAIDRWLEFHGLT
ncbi:alpha/beta hydrolase [Aeromicrobium sp. Leaf350]|uniref:alpha/beta hydrolase n=1 Tax=Aeromicrobium sp. Leaf350 TaxID=2876565 RepID=UPI001E44F750|nr:alpha/beta hydrolase [Aeromicrobium sp. Leaf350]